MRIETPRIYLPRTGQTTSFADGDDGYFQAGNPRATRFVDNGNGTISDRATGLQWVQDPADCGEAFYTGGALVSMNWADALAACLALDYAGFTDWRLPNVVELLSLANWDSQSWFFGAGTDAWSSTTRHWNATYAWLVNPAGTPACTGPKSTLYYVRPVRGGRING